MLPFKRVFSGQLTLRVTIFEKRGSFLAGMVFGVFWEYFCLFREYQEIDKKHSDCPGKMRKPGETFVLKEEGSNDNQEE